MDEVIPGFKTCKEQEKAAYSSLREAQARLRDTPVGPERESVRADIDYWMEEVKAWSRAQASVLFHTKRRASE